MKKEFDLSEKLRSECHGELKCYCDCGLVADEKDVKEFIRLLKDTFAKEMPHLHNIEWGMDEIEEIIDNLAGDELK